MLSTNNLLQPSNGEPITAPTLDMVLGCYYLTIILGGMRGEGPCVSPTRTTRGWSHDLGQIHLQASIKVRIAEPEALDAEGNGHANGNGNGNGHEQGVLVSTSVGRIIFNEAINTTLHEAGVEVSPYHNDINGQEQPEEARRALDPRLTATTSRRACSTLSSGSASNTPRDRASPSPSVTSRCPSGRRRCWPTPTRIARIENDYRRGLITDEERYNDVVADLDQGQGRNHLGRQQALDPFGSVYLMASSGAKGNVQQIAQMAGMRGLMADPSGRIIELPIRSASATG